MCSTFQPTLLSGERVVLITVTLHVMFLGATSQFLVISNMDGDFSFQQLADTLTDGPGKLHPIKCDISKEEDILCAFSEVKERLGGVDILVNSAGVFNVTTLSGSASVLCHLNPFHTTALHFCKMHFNIILLYMSTSSVVTIGFPSEMVCSFISPCVLHARFSRPS